MWLGLYLAIWANEMTYATGVRFTLPLLNYGFFFAAQWIPFKLFGLAMHWRGIRRFALVVLIVPFILVAFPSALGLIACVAFSPRIVRGDDGSFERLQAVGAPRGRVSVYRTNGGATTAFGIVVRQECGLVPGLLLIEHEIANKYEAHGADVTFTSPDTALVVMHLDNGGVESVSASLRRWPCVM